jgi:hypothetical protein
MAEFFVRQYDEILLEIAEKITRQSCMTGYVRLCEMDAYEIREAARVLKTLRNRVKELEGK